MKAGGDLSTSKLKGAIAPEELLYCTRPSSPRSPRSPRRVDQEEEEIANFLEIDPRDGFGVRNFQIQACKMATVSDIIVYGDDGVEREEVQALARKIARAQKAWRERSEMATIGSEHVFNTFVVTGGWLPGGGLEYLADHELDSFSKFEAEHDDIVAIDSKGDMTGKVMDFCKPLRPV